MAPSWATARLRWPCMSSMVRWRVRARVWMFAHRRCSALTLCLYCLTAHLQRTLRRSTSSSWIYSASQRARALRSIVLVPTVSRLHAGVCPRATQHARAGRPGRVAPDCGAGARRRAPPNAHRGAPLSVILPASVVVTKKRIVCIHADSSGDAGADGVVQRGAEAALRRGGHGGAPVQAGQAGHAAGAAAQVRRCSCAAGAASASASASSTCAAGHARQRMGLTGRSTAR
jgi:hypothetical protein